jgi:hypothetical protein
MSTTYEYSDAYLAKFCTEAIEERATADIAIMGTFNDYWTEKLIVLRTYILACLENQADTEDLFTAKLKSYRAEMTGAATAAQAQAAADAAEASGAVNGFGVFSIPLERA